MPETIAILGPTAVGKSWLGMELAEVLGGEIVSADALQVYRDFSIGTAKPSHEDQRRVRHHLIDILAAEESFSAGEFARRALLAIDEIHGRGRLPLVLGGSGLYLRALLEGISPIPPTDPSARTGLRERLEAEGLESLRAELSQVDPATASRLRAGDTQRVLRALEVFRSTGKPLSSWLREDPVGSGPLDAIRVGLTMPRSLLYDRIADRVRGMIQAGWLGEVEDLLDRGLDPELPPFQAIGYRELVAHLGGETSLEEAVSSTIRATCRFAKRQMTWFRKEREVVWFSMEDPADCRKQVLEYLDRVGIGGGNGQTEH